jgi:putative nucleotidyltransferase with HDIG domain
MEQNTIENRLLLEFNKAGVARIHQGSIVSLLLKLRRHDEATYVHSIRVALLSAKMARVLKIDPKPLLFSGCLHDVGKLYVPGELLRQKNYDPNTQPEIDKHILYSYEILREIHPFSAEIALMHHRFQTRKNKLTPELLNPKISLNARKKATKIARLLAIADHFNAATTRINPKLKRGLTLREAEKLLLKEFPKQRGVIKKLISSKVFVGEAPTTQAPKIPQIKRRKKVSTLPKIQKRNLFKRRA